MAKTRKTAKTKKAPKIRKMPADFSRCLGSIYHKGKVDCPQRETCLRFKSPPHDMPNQCWVFVAGEEYIGNCDSHVGVNQDAT